MNPYINESESKGQVWPLFEQELGIETSWDSLQPEWSYELILWVKKAFAIPFIEE